MFEIRPFHRRDRDQVAALVNAHVQAVIPGVTVSVNAVLSQLEREPAEFVVDPWVAQRTTLVAEQRGRIVAATHLLRYGTDEAIGSGYRGLGELRWFVLAPDAPFWPDASLAARGLLAAAVAGLEAAGSRRIAVDGALPAPGVFGLPDCWPHVLRVLADGGFVPAGRREQVWLLDLRSVGAPPKGLEVRRSVGASGTRLAACVDGREAGAIEVEVRSSESGATGRQTGWADVGDLRVAQEHRRRGIARALVAVAADWLRLGHVDRLLEYSDAEDVEAAAFLEAVGFRRLVTATRGWERPTS